MSRRSEPSATADDASDGDRSDPPVASAAGADEPRSEPGEKATGEVPEGGGGRSWKRRALSYGLQALVVIAVVWGMTWYQARRLLPTRSEAPAFALPSLGGDTYRLADARGRKVVLYFFAPWCTVCEFSSHNVNALREARTDEELAIYAIGLGWEEPAELSRFAEEHALGVPVLEGGTAIQRAYQVDTFPSIYIIDEQGRIEDRVVGYTTELGLRLRSL